MCVILRWHMGSVQHGDGRRWLLAAPGLLLLGSVAGAAAELTPSQRGHAAAGSAFSDAALARARASGKPVFVYFTADWCLSCKANEAGAIERDAVQAAFDKAGVVTLDRKSTRLNSSH